MTKLFIQLFLFFLALGIEYFHRSISLSLFCFYQVLSSFNNRSHTCMYKYFGFLYILYLKVDHGGTIFFYFFFFFSHEIVHDWHVLLKHI